MCLVVGMVYKSSRAALENLDRLLLNLVSFKGIIDSITPVTLPLDTDNMGRILNPYRKLTTTIVDHVATELLELLSDDERKFLWVTGCQSWMRQSNGAWYHLALKTFPRTVDVSCAQDITLLMPRYAENHYTLSFVRATDLDPTSSTCEAGTSEQATLPSSSNESDSSSSDSEGKQMTIETLDSLSLIQFERQRVQGGVVTKYVTGTHRQSGTDPFHIKGLMERLRQVRKWYPPHITVLRADADVLKTWAGSKVPRGRYQVNKGSQPDLISCGVIVAFWMVFYILHPSQNHDELIKLLPDAKSIVDKNIGRRVICQLLLRKYTKCEWRQVLSGNTS